MTPFHEGFTRAVDMLRSSERMTGPADQVVVRPRSVGYRIGRGLVSLGAHMMGARITTEPVSNYELAA